MFFFEFLHFIILFFSYLKTLVFWFILGVNFIGDFFFNFLFFFLFLWFFLPIFFYYFYSLKMFYSNRWISPDFFFFIFFFVFETNDLDFFLDFWPEVVIDTELVSWYRNKFFKFPLKFNFYKDWRYFPQVDDFLNWRSFGETFYEGEKQFRQWGFSKTKFFYLKNLFFFLLFPDKFLKNKLGIKEVKPSDVQVFVKNKRLLHNFFNRFFFFNFKYLRQTVIYRRPRKISILFGKYTRNIFSSRFPKVERVSGKHYKRFKYYYYIRLKRFRKIVKRVRPKLYMRFKRLKWRRFWWKRIEKRKLNAFFDFFSFLVPFQRNRRIYMLRREYKVYIQLLDFLHNRYLIVSNRDMNFKLPLLKRAVAPYVSVNRLNQGISFEGLQEDYFKAISGARDVHSIFFWSLRKPKSFLNLSFFKKHHLFEFQNIFLYSDFFFSFRVMPFFDFDDFFSAYRSLLVEEDFSFSQDVPPWWDREILVYNEIVLGTDYYYHEVYVGFFFYFWCFFIFIFILFLSQVFSFFTFLSFLDFDFSFFEGFFRKFFVFLKALFLEILSKFFWED